LVRVVVPAAAGSSPVAHPQKGLQCPGAYERRLYALEGSPGWSNLGGPALAERIERPTEVFRLAPTSRPVV
jgi:hypothetical protein